MAQPPPDQNFYHHPHPHAHPHPHSHPQLQLPPQFRNPFDLLFDDRTGAINYNYIRPYLPNQLQKPDELSESLVMRRPRRTRTTFTSSQIAELEQHFLQGRYLTAPRLAELSSKLALGTAQVKIWFKNRRRRHKIQTDQHKDQSYDGMPPLSPSMKSESDPPSLQALSLTNNCNVGDAATSNVLTPSPTPTTPATNLIDHYGESFNSYYYNGHHNSHVQPPTRQAATGQPSHQFVNAPSTPNTSQYFPGTGIQHHSHQLQQQQHHQVHQNFVQNGTHQLQQQLQQQHQQYHHFDQFQLKNNGGSSGCRVSVLKDDPDSNYNFNNNPFYTRVSAPAANTDPSSVILEANAAVSPVSEIYEPLTPKNDDSSSICNGNGSNVTGTSTGNMVDHTVEMDPANKKSLQSLESVKTNGLNKASYDRSVFKNSQSLSMAICDGVFNKYAKMLPPHDAALESSYQCTMDTIMQAYNPHRNSTASNAQFAYCFN